MKKIFAAAPCTLLAFALFGCTQHSTAPAVAAPDASTSKQASGDTNTFGESKEQAAGSAAAARDANPDSNSATASPDTQSPTAPPPKANPDPK